jgi:uncharacterized protein (DUF2141 family)
MHDPAASTATPEHTMTFLLAPSRPRGLAALALAVALPLAAALPLHAHAADLTLSIEPVGEATGTIQIALYDSEANFRKQSVRALKLPAIAGTMTVRIADLPPGEYAVMIFHDRNGNDKLDANAMGIPKEPWGGSLGDKSVFGAPGWADVRFALKDEGAAQRIKLSD